jgi:hypothetical protein
LEILLWLENIARQVRPQDVHRRYRFIVQRDADAR